MTRPSPRRHRPGFTLVELLVVIVIIGILIALLVPVIMSAIRTTRNAAVTAVVVQLADALAAFKEKYGDYPPSRIILCENGFYNTTDPETLGNYAQNTGWFSNQNLINGVLTEGDLTIPYAGNGDITYGALAQRSLRFLRKFFPQAQFSSNAVLFTATNSNQLTWHDFNGNFNPAVGAGNGVGQSPDPPYLLQGHECLVFFLGGIPSSTRAALNTSTSSGAIGMTGFANSPLNPFQNDAVTTNRGKPFFEFSNDRLVDDDGDGIPGYVDSLGSSNDRRYYAYFSSYGQGAYDPNDVNFVELDDTGSTPISRIFQVTFPVGNPPTNVVGSFAPNPYTTSDPVPPAVGVTPTVFIQPNTFQIISAGSDFGYGIGGKYDPSATNNRLPLNDPANVTPSTGLGVRIRERDNLSNFATTKLE